jgi:transcriptional regulator with GAF, ATPase, and Fis domain
VRLSNTQPGLGLETNLRDSHAVHSLEHDVQAIAATLRIPQSNEELRPRPAGLAIEVLDGVDAGLHTVAGEQITVGRGPLCDIRLGDTSVSEFHFRLTVGTEEVLLEDLGSSNGLWIGRARVDRAHLLPGARFRAGVVRLQLREIATAPSAVTLDDEFFGLRGRSEAMRALFAVLARVAPTPLSVLVTGETGVGKGQLVRALHRASGRTGRLITVDCTALPREMADSLLFGHAKGSFTGATSDRPSPFEDAHGGTLFLDEIGELPVELQPKLLRVIDERVVQRLGSSTPRTVDVRLVAATNRDLRREISAGRFRADLYHRMAGFVVQIPPLRSRRDDIPFLASLFLAEVDAQLGKGLRVGAQVAEELGRRDWPGNVRELRQTILRAAYLGDGPELAVRNLVQYDETADDSVTEPMDARLETAGCKPLRPLLDEFKRNYCIRLLVESTTISAAAETAGFSLRGLQLMLHKLGVKAEDHLGGGGH